MIGAFYGNYLQRYFLIALCIHVIFPVYILQIPPEFGIGARGYWLHKKQELIPQRLTNDFVIESLKFVLKNNNVLFDDHMCFLNYLEQQWVQNVLPHMLV